MRVASHFGLAFHTGTRLAVLLAAVLLISPRQGQALLQDDAPFRLRTDTRVVEIDVSVRDSQGRPVENLDKTDFKVTDNGKARPFTIFSINRGLTMSASRGAQPDNPPALAAGSTLPPNVFSNAGAFTPPQGHSTILLVDAINGWFDNFGLARQAVLGLLTKAPADEKIALYVLVKGVGMVTLQSYTTDRSKLATAIAQFTPRGMPAAPPRMEGSEGMIETPSNGKQDVSFSREPDLVQAGFTSIEEKEFAVRISAEDVRAALNGLAEQLKNVPGRKSVFWITQGFPPAQVRDVNQAGWDKTFTNLNDANIAVNTVDDNGLGGPLRYWGPGAIRTLQQVAEATGGQAYFYRNDLDAAMASGIADSRSSYTLGFYLTQMDGKYHKLRVRVDRPGLELTYRLGYYAQNEGIRDASGRKSDLRAAMLNPTGSANVEITARLDVVPGSPHNTLNAHMTLGPEPLTIKKTSAGYSGKIEEMFVEQDADGHVVARFSDAKQFTVSESDKDLFDSRGVTLLRTIPLVDGAAKLLIVVRDMASGRVGSLAIPVGQIAVPGVRN